MKKLLLGLTLLTSMSSFANSPLAECSIINHGDKPKDFKLSVGNNAYFRVEGLGQKVTSTGNTTDLFINVSNPEVDDKNIEAYSLDPFMGILDGRYKVKISTLTRDGAILNGLDEELVKLSSCEFY